MTSARAENEDRLASVIGSGLAQQAVNVRVSGPNGRLVLHAGHLAGFAPSTKTPEALLAAEAIARVRGWLDAARPLFAFHSLRLYLGGGRPDGFDPDRIVFEWKVGPQPLTSHSISAFGEGDGDYSHVVSYPAEGLASLRTASRTLAELTEPGNDGLRIFIKTRLLEPRWLEPRLLKPR